MIKTNEGKLTKKNIYEQARIDAHRNVSNLIKQVSNIDLEQRNRKDQFLELYTKCEIIYKNLYPAYKLAKDGKQIDVKQLKINVQLIETGLRFASIPYDTEEVKMIFSIDSPYKKKGNRSCNILRNNIIHDLDPESISEVYNRFDELVSIMNKFVMNAVI